ncbi:PAS domain S-box protein [Mesorhizobium sp. NBSH29]|uniref:PAS domain S-box protein n=1 Tax=Mesorhizobium sp. NBSH29 TaxID=2654249 RepID=UPI0018965137|nr:PAS domain S-box protein [Mesorhizobium sp. NBSH29]QPC87664.1 PAS domain S-box protein [Mesorhizobium sp. NBSH29]
MTELPASPLSPSTSADARLAAIVDSSYDAIISKDLNSIIATWNKGAERMFGYTAVEAVGRSILMLIPDGLQGEEDDIISKVRSGIQVPSYETTRKRKDGTLIFVSLTVSPIRDADGVIVGASKIARDITSTKENERRIRFLMREVNHRVKNQFAVILSMVRETGKRSTDPRELEDRIRDRIMALSRSHDLLVNTEWAGAHMEELVREHLKPFGHDGQITFAGPNMLLNPNGVQHLGMAIHELGTNSAKHGALADDRGTVHIAWRKVNSDHGAVLQIDWNESFEPPAGERREPSTRKGFGTVVLMRVAPQSLGGTAELEKGERHLRWSLTAPLKNAIALPATDAHSHEI